MGKNLITVGLGFGDEGKGSLVEYLVEKYELEELYSIKYNGGCQGKHTVDTPFCYFSFSQLSPSILRNKNKLFLTSNFVFEICALINELNSLSSIMNKTVSEYLDNIYIDENCICVTPYHKLYNIIEENSKNKRGSVGTGVSIAKYLSEICPELILKAKYLNSSFQKERFDNLLKQQKGFIINFCRNKGYDTTLIENYDIMGYISEIEDILNKYNIQIVNVNKYLKENNKICIYESSQGFLLDKKYGFIPNTTLLDTSLDSLINLDGERIGAIRSLYTRHGIGFFPTESKYLENILEDRSQEVGKFSGKIRFGWFDCVLLRYALSNTNVNSIYMSHMDYLKFFNIIKICNRYEYVGKIDDIFKKYFEYKIENGNVYVYNIRKGSNKLSDYLKNLIPCYIDIVLKGKGFKEKCDEYIEYIVQECHIPIKYISIGKSCLDKIEIG